MLFPEFSETNTHIFAQVSSGSVNAPNIYCYIEINNQLHVLGVAANHSNKVYLLIYTADIDFECHI